MCYLMNIFLTALMVQSGLAVSCYICDSTSNEKCKDLSDKSIQPENCTYDKLGYVENPNDASHRDISWLLKLSEINYFKLRNPFDIPMVCQKLVGTDEETQITTVIRRCQLRDIEPCNFMAAQKRQENRHIDFCGVCPTDGCNGSSKTLICGMMIAILSAIVISLNFVL